MNNTKLPTKEEYEKSISISSCRIEQWSEPKYQCSEFGGGMCKNLMVTLTSIPPMYEYSCNKCGHVDYQYQ